MSTNWTNVRSPLHGTVKFTSRGSIWWALTILLHRVPNYWRLNFKRCFPFPEIPTMLFISHHELFRLPLSLVFRFEDTNSPRWSVLGDVLSEVLKPFRRQKIGCNFQRRRVIGPGTITIKLFWWKWWQTQSVWPEKNCPNVHETCPKMISLEKW